MAYGLMPPSHVAYILTVLPVWPDAGIIVRFDSGAITVLEIMVVVVVEIDVLVMEFIT
jgi:hypothetical protein